MESREGKGFGKRRGRQNRCGHLVWLLGALAACSTSSQEPDGLDTPEESTPTVTPQPASPTGQPASPTPEGTPQATETPEGETSVPETPPAIGEDYLVLVPDNGANQFKLIDPVAERLVYSLDLSVLNPSLCPESYQGCFIFGGMHQQLEGHDFLDITYGQPVEGGGLGTGFEGNLERVQLSDPPQTRWRLKGLNFSGLAGGAQAYCPAVDPADPCAVKAGSTPQQAGLCWVGDAHDFVVIQDDTAASQVELMVADTDNLRMFKVILDYAGGNTCGEVTAFVDARRNPDWYPGSQPNNLEPVPVEGRELYLVGQRSVSTGSSIAGDGVLQLWELEPDGHFTWHWTFPEQPEGQTHAFRLPHGGELTWEERGETALFRFGDSASLATSTVYDNKRPPGGSVGVLRFEDVLEPPDYQHDLYQPAGDSVWGFPRAATKVPNGLLLVTDSACQLGFGCFTPVLPRLLWIQDLETLDSSRGGYWTPDHGQLELLDQSPRLVKSLSCGLVGPYWSMVVPREAWGKELSEAAEEGGSRCPQ